MMRNKITNMIITFIIKYIMPNSIIIKYILECYIIFSSTWIITILNYVTPLFCIKMSICYVMDTYLFFFFNSSCYMSFLYYILFLITQINIMLRNLRECDHMVVSSHIHFFLFIWNFCWLRMKKEIKFLLFIFIIVCISILCSIIWRNNIDIRFII